MSRGLGFEFVSETRARVGEFERTGPIVQSNMAARRAADTIHKLHAVTLIRSGIRQPWWEKRTLKALGLTKLNQTVIHKNIPAVNGILRSVKHLIDVRPVKFVEEGTSRPPRRGVEDVFLTADGKFDPQRYQQYLERNPEMREVLKSRK